jgi:coenzyme Q-binding protein COQ10
MKNQSIQTVTFSLTVFLFLILLCPCVKAAPLAFKDNKGKIVDRGQDYIVRLIDTPGSKIKTAEALFIVKASPDVAYKVITDYEHYPEFMPNMVKTSILERSGSVTKCKFTLKIALFTVEYSLTLKSDIHALPYSVTWDFIEGDIKNTTGSWAIDKDGKGGHYSLVHYSVHTEPGGITPDWITNKLSSESIPDMITAIRKRAGNAH